MKEPLIDLRDLHVYGGLAILAAGAGWVFLPAAPIILGVGLIAIAYSVRRAG